MGGKIILPEQDLNILKVMKTFHFTPADIASFLKIFNKLDKTKTGFVPLTQIFKTIHCERNLITDCLLELLEIEHDGEIIFSDFLYMVVSYCFFEPTHILKLFDQDKTGYFSIEDLNSLLNVLHSVRNGETVKGTVKASWSSLTFSDTKFEFDEFKKIHNQFPKLFEPAFRLQYQMKSGFKGEAWWNHKKRIVENFAERAEEKILQAKKRKEKKKKEKKNSKIKRNMGVLRYYICPCIRMYYDPELSEYDKLSKEQKAERDRLMIIAKRQAELKVKNPETAPWLQYKKKVVEKTRYVATNISDNQPEHNDSNNVMTKSIKNNDNNINNTTSITMNSNNNNTTDSNDKNNEVNNDINTKTTIVNDFLDEKMYSNSRYRDGRAETRADRKKQRSNDPDLQIKPRTTISGVSY